MEPTTIIIIVLFVLLLVVCVFIDKNTSKKFRKKIMEEYPIKDSYENAYVTEKGELLFYLPSGTISGYKKWDLKDIAYISTFKGSFSLEDENKKSMRGEYLTPSKKKKLLKENAYRSFPVGTAKIDQYVEFIQKHGKHIKHMVGGKVQD